MSQDTVVAFINEKIYPRSLNKKEEASIALLVNKYSYDFLIECINISASRYFQYDMNGVLIPESIDVFLSKIGGIAHNKSLSPVENQIRYFIKIVKDRSGWWNQQEAKYLLYEYINALRICLNYTEDDILQDLQGQTSRVLMSTTSWSRWTTIMVDWINDVKSSNN